MPGRRVGELLAAAFGAALLLLAFSLPVFATPPGPTKLLGPDVAPRTGTTATPITFRVTYRNAHDLPPDYVRVIVGSVTYAMAGSGTDWKSGVVFTLTMALPAGNHAVRFEARDAERFPDTQDAGTVTIGQAPVVTPPPTPTPTPSPAPTPDPIDPPDSDGGGTTPPSSGGSGGTDGSGGAGDGSSGSVDSDGSGAGTSNDLLDPNPSRNPDARSGLGPGTGSTAGSSPTGEASSGGSTDGDSTGAGSWAPDAATGVGAGDDWPTSAVVPPAPLAGEAWPDVPGGSGQGGQGGAWISETFGGGLPAFGLTALGLTDGAYLPTIPAVVGSTVLVTSWMAFVLFNKRRRDGEPPAPDPVLHAAAATGIGMGAVLAPAPVAPPDPEALMPRWRRPSLLEARKTDPIRAPAPERPRLTFAPAGAGGAVAAGLERRPIRYAVIPLLDRPDEIQAMRIGELAAGDEVEVRQRSGAYCHVLCPDGRVGWVHRTTLGEVIVAPRTTGGRTIEAHPEPEAENALAAFLEARGLR